MSEEMPETPGVTYEVLDFAPPEAVVGRIFRLYQEVFGDGDQADLVEQLGRRTTVMAVLAREDVEVVGFKVGFEDAPGVFRSWLGAVSDRWRGKGVGARLLHDQHEWCAVNGYDIVRTHGTNRFKEMLVLNLRHGFDIVGTRIGPEGELHVLLEKSLESAAASPPPSHTVEDDDSAD